MHHRIASLSFLALTGFLLTGCEPQAEAPLEVRLAEASEAIEGGYKDDLDKHVVGLIRFGAGIAGCSGTLIAPNVVLTAKHCVAPSTAANDVPVQCGLTTFGSTYPASQMLVTTETTYPPTPTVGYRGVYEILVPPADNAFCGNDQAIMILTELIGESEAVPAVPRVDEVLLPNEEYYAIGYGQQFDSENAPSGVRQRRDFLFTQCIGDECQGSSINDKEWLGDTAVCSGDSGGPALDIKNRVIGVASRGASGCEFPIYGNPFGWGQWIKDTVIYAAGLGQIAPPPWATGYPTDPAYSLPVGGPCNGDPANCASGACVEDYCTRPCNDLAPCPDTYECGLEGWCVAIPEPEDPPSDDGDSSAASSCAVTQPGVASQDPTKPIPWKWGALLAGLAWLGRRRQD